MQELYESVLQSRDLAHERLRMVAAIERGHHDTPLCDLVALATNGDLHRRTESEPAEHPPTEPASPPGVKASQQFEQRCARTQFTAMTCSGRTA